MVTAPAARLSLSLVVAIGCGRQAVSAAPRSTCGEAAAAIARGLRQATGEPATAVEQPFADLCRSAAWRPAVVRCFALARDPGEHRVCARRLEPEQRNDARVLQAEPYGQAARPGASREVRLPPACMRLRGAFERFVACDRLAVFREEVAAQLTAVLARASEGGLDPALVAIVASECDRLGAALQSAVGGAGC